MRLYRPDEWQVLRELRLRALASDPDAFRDSLAHALRDDTDLVIQVMVRSL
jgi:hypothetical protein